MKISRKEIIKQEGIADTTNNTIYDADELSKYLKIKKNTIYIWVSQRKIPYVKLGRRTVFLKKEIDRWLNENLIREKDLEFTFRR